MGLISSYDRRPGESVRRGLGDPAFDAQTVPYIRADDGHFLEIPYQPNSCGTHTIVVEGGSEPGIVATSSVALDVGIDTDSALRFLISEVRNLRLAHVKPVDPYIKRTLIWKLRVANWMLDAGRTKRGVYSLQAFNRQVTALAHVGRINAQKADFLVGQSDEIIGCVWSIHQTSLVAAPCLRVPIRRQGCRSSARSRSTPTVIRCGRSSANCPASPQGRRRVDRCLPEPAEHRRLPQPGLLRRRH